MKLSISEILDKASKEPDFDKRVAYLKQNDSVVMQHVFHGIYNPNVVWMLPEGTPPYKPSVIVDQQHIFFNQVRMLQYFVKGPHDGLNYMKREQMFINLLEVLDPDDAKLLISMKDKVMPYPNLGLDVAQALYPGQF